MGLYQLSPFKQPHYPHIGPIMASGLLLVLVLVQPGLTQQQPTAPVILSGKCLELCNQRRPRNHASQFQFTCDDESKCLHACESCPRDVCDETRMDTDKPWRNWYCPADQDYSPTCKIDCDKARTNPGRSGLQKCDTMHPGDNAAERQCKRNCNTCPEYVCDPNSKIYDCPAVNPADMTGMCRDFCSKITIDDPDKDHVKVDCYYGNYQLPSGYSTKEDYCKAVCDACTDANGFNYRCDRGDPSTIWCSRLPETRLEWRSYKGPCRNRCDAGQGGGPQPYEIHCDNNYETTEEKDKCKEACSRFCPPEMCLNDKVIKCPGDKKELKRLEEIRLQKEQEKKERERIRREEEQAEIKKTKESEDALIGHSVGVGLLVALLLGLIVAWSYYCCCAKKKPGGMEGGQGQQQAPENYYDPATGQPVNGMGAEQGIDGQANLGWQQDGSQEMNLQPGYTGGEPGQVVTTTSGGT